MARIARTPAEVIASEISYASPETAWADALAIASVVYNRSLALQVTPQQVVGVKKEFNAYNGAMPAGADVDLAQQAIDNVSKFGPVTAATFYAMPRAVENLPPTKQFDMAVDGGHQYFTETSNGAIQTKAGWRAPVDIASVRSAAAQRKAYEMALVDENAAGLPTPEARPDEMLASAVTPGRVAVAPVPIPTVETWSDMAEAGPITATPTAATTDQLAAAAARFGEDPAPAISTPADLQAALSRMNVPAANPIDISRAMDEAIAQSVAASEPSFDDGRMADNGPMSEADRALAGMMKESAANAVTDRFAGPARPVTQTVKTTTVPGQVPAGSYVPGTMPAAFNTDAVAARSVPTTTITRDMINSPAALSAALTSIGSSPAMAQADAAKGDRIGGIDTSGMDTSRFGPDALHTADAALKDAISRATAPASQPADIAGFSDAMAAQRGAPNGINSAEAQAQQGHVAYEAQKAAAAEAAAKSNLEAQQGVAAPQAEKARAVETWSDMAAAGPVTAAPADAAASFAEEVASQKTDRLSAQDAARMARTTGIPAPTSFDMVNNPAQAAIDAAIATPAPALETVNVAPQPAIAAVEDVAPAQITPAVTSAKTSTLPAQQQRQSTAMDVWGGKAQTGIATDGSTVSRLSDNRIGRFVPSHNYTVFTTDDGATWSSPVAGNQLAPKTSSLASIQPAVSQSLISRLVSALTGQVPAASPTDVGPSMGLDGGMSVGRDGPAGAPAGWGPGGSISNPGSAGGYGSTNGKDPNGTR